MQKISNLVISIATFLVVSWLPNQTWAQGSAAVKCLVSIGKDVVVQMTADCYLDGLTQYLEGEEQWDPGLSGNPDPLGYEVWKGCEFTPVVAEAIDLAYCAEAVATRVDTIIIEHQNRVKKKELAEKAREIGPGYYKDAYEACGHHFKAHYDTYIQLINRFRRERDPETKKRILAEIKAFLEYVRPLALNTGINNCDQSTWGRWEDEIINKCFFDHPDYEDRDFVCLGL